ncbi:tripartite motif-containing protein 2-like [Plakobranchus ocellatus]|uniref:Tripartite motif-containing protein 2-like n=1 Tax=Plakobranchus ocellatus TaxID=259542 RepID=A0AAV4BA35_9GAST|nr:tripartite motif-containing protein 2-like [Plakobranchus ocellatus]
MQKNCSSLELQVSASADSMTSKVLHLDKKLANLKSNVHALDSETRESLKDLSEVSKENSNAVKGLRKLQSLLKQTNQAAAAVTPPQIAATASASVSAISRPLKGVSHMKNFSARTTADQYTPQIVDVKLLAGGRLVLADDGNTCIKLFNTQGQHLCNLKNWDQPRRLAVIDSCGTSNSHTVAVTLPFCRGIDILEIAGDNIKVKKPLKTSRLYDAVAAVSKLTLAVGYRVLFHPPAIDLIDLEGQVLRKICSGVDPSYMDVTDDGNLICSSQDNTIARVQMNSGTVVFNKAVPMIIRPHGVAIAADKSLLITDTWDNVLHLVSPQGDRSKQLWLAPSGKDQGDDLCGLSMDGSVCVCVTGHGTVYVLDCMC